MNGRILNELEVLTQRIEQNTATLTDYKRYEMLLLNGGLTHSYIFSYLNRAGFNTWEDFVLARRNKEMRNKDVEGAVVGGLIGLGLGLLLLGLFSDKK